MDFNAILYLLKIKFISLETRKRNHAPRLDYDTFSMQKRIMWNLNYLNDSTFWLMKLKKNLYTKYISLEITMMQFGYI